MVIKLYPDLVHEHQFLKDYNSDCEHDASYLDRKINNKLIVENVKDTAKNFH
jgi:hypothetical protein